MSKVGLKEVAALAGVATGTVSHFLNHPEIVSEEKARRIRRAIDELGFVPNNAGRQLRSGRNPSIAYLVPALGDPFFARVADGVELRAAEFGMSVLIADSGNDPERLGQYLQLFEQQQVRGMLIADQDGLDARIQRIRDRGTPSVVVPRPTDDSLDHAVIGSAAVDRLISEMNRTPPMPRVTASDQLIEGI